MPRKSRIGGITMQIQGPMSLHGPHAINAPHRSKAAHPAEASKPAVPTDQLDISREAELVSQMRDVPDIRADKVAQIRAQIEAGTYETDEKLDIALDHLLNELV